MDTPETGPSSHLQSSFAQLRDDLQQCIIGQPHLVQCLLVALLADGHLLVEGAPGLAKTTAVKALAARIEADFHRVQFTPDLLPADLTGTDVFRPQSGSFEFERGPLFHNIVLADEINRAPAKVQSALLEAMAEQQITVGRRTWQLPELFMVMATQNPIEQEGTFTLPEAQLDRFLMHVTIGYPDATAELAILKLAREQASRRAHPVAAAPALLSQADVFAARDAAMAVHMAPALEEYLTQLVLATRDAGHYGPELKRWIAWGGSPRATIALDRCSRAQAWLSGRDYVLPEDVHAIAHEVLRHRVLLSYEAEAEGVRPDQVIGRLLDLVPLP
ncbi:MoxR family ATPase [Rhodanobacter sp. FDAARGOS 1247]|uniref:AAA family ATPase n=1 Tax=Rhodanobacter sp. FDAARGOS 1247 TaxID=2778082 RepID=UPI00195158CE|nr:MoxR family ATPase [Rhodanobacter sp. FDAARGOS 1247]QRP64473.1 MoxR family ATPase [Rhodanobacter sp. FDAARGOS 1247]